MILPNLVFGLLRVTLLALVATSPTAAAALPAGDFESIQHEVHHGPSTLPPSISGLLTRDDPPHEECWNYHDNLDKSSPASPIWQDCIQLRYNIRNGGLWKAPAGTQTRLVKYQTCAIGVNTEKGSTPWLGALYKVGNRDLIKFIELTEELVLNKSSPSQVFKDPKDGKKKIKWDARVGSQGKMDCYQFAAFGAGFEANWGLYYYCPDNQVCDEEDWWRRYDRGEGFRG